jgi:drug/metabolite transporter (DMT)-like permease
VTSSLPEPPDVLPPESPPDLPPMIPLAPSPTRWIWLAVGALVAWGFWSFLPKLALQSMKPHSVIFYEAIGNLITAIPVFIILRGRLTHSRVGISISAFVSALTVGAFLLYFFALHHGPVATVVTLTALYPIVVLIMARVFLKEKLNNIQMASVALAVCSIYLLAGG